VRSAPSAHNYRPALGSDAVCIPNISGNAQFQSFSTAPAHPEVSTTTREITNRVNEISFNSSLMREMRAVGFVTKLIEPESWGKKMRTFDLRGRHHARTE
jgi:hypothetical protein